MTAILLDTPRRATARPRRRTQTRLLGSSHSCRGLPASDRKRVTFVERPVAEPSERMVLALLIAIVVIAAAAVITITATWLAIPDTPMAQVSTHQFTELASIPR